jgi:integrase
MRRGEILTLTWPHINFKENLIALDSQDTKTGRRRIIPVSQRLRATLLEIRQAGGKVADISQRVFLSERGKPFAQAESIRQAFENTVERAKLADVHFHDLRRSFATRKVTEGWDRDFVKAITGHTTDKVFARYNKPSLDTLRAVVEGTPRNVVVKPLSNGSGREDKTVLSA